MEIKKFTILIRWEEIYQSMQCKKGDVFYYTILEEYEKMKDEIHQLLKPRLFLEMENWNLNSYKIIDCERKAYYVAMTLGEQISLHIDKLFADGEYIKGMLFDHYAVLYLFHMEEYAKKLICGLCEKDGYRIEKQMEADKDYPFQEQKKIVEICQRNKIMQIRVNRLGMLSPVKSMVFVFVLTNKKHTYKMEHRCRDCMRKDCYMRKHEIEPVFDQHSKILILGTFPSVKSREMQFFYGHPQNRFWKVLAGIYEVSPPITIEEKKAFLLQFGIAVWDVIASCNIIGSSDSSITDVEVNDLSRILDYAAIQEIYVNGNKAYELYKKYCYQETKREAIKLPSTSPANASYSLERLKKEWLVIKNSCLLL